MLRNIHLFEYEVYFSIKSGWYMSRYKEKNNCGNIPRLQLLSSRYILVIKTENCKNGMQ